MSKKFIFYRHSHQSTHFKNPFRLKELSESRANEQKRKEEMMMYKRELLNREENFNAIFAPNVGGVSSKFKENSLNHNDSKRLTGGKTEYTRGKARLKNQDDRLVKSNILGRKQKGY